MTTENDDRKQQLKAPAVCPWCLRYDHAADCTNEWHLTEGQHNVYCAACGRYTPGCLCVHIRVAAGIAERKRLSMISEHGARERTCAHCSRSFPSTSTHSCAEYVTDETGERHWDGTIVTRWDGREQQLGSRSPLEEAHHLVANATQALSSVRRHGTFDKHVDEILADLRAALPILRGERDQKDDSVAAPPEHGLPVWPNVTTPCEVHAPNTVALCDNCQAATRDNGDAVWPREERLRECGMCSGEGGWEGGGPSAEGYMEQVKCPECDGTGKARAEV